MAVTNYENIISNLSYTEKDFQSIYPALLDLVGKETLKWNPRSSNESDPGVVLLKLNALVADKCNYNIDKNVLECFPVSVTQEANARQLFEQLGYYMHWYQAAETIVTLKYIGKQLVDSKDEIRKVNYTIPKFTMISDEDHNIVYTITEEKTLCSDGTTQNFLAMQGVITDFAINGSTAITTANLDSNNRLYFVDSTIAENGIFICNIGQKNYSAWQKKDNLLVQEVNVNNKFYKFGVASDLKTCYIEFPENCEELFQEGINIKYLRTSGENGNIAPYILDIFYTDLNTVNAIDSTETIILNTDNTKILNYINGINGKDPESINDAYKGYKKTIGTFDTLITLRDYRNAVRRSEYVSNAIVSDRLSDPQSSYDIVTQNGALDQIIHMTEGAKQYDIEGYYLDGDFYYDKDATKFIDPNEDYNYFDLDTGKTYRVIYNSDNENDYNYIEARPVSRPAMDAFDIKLYLLQASSLMQSATNFNTTFALNLDEAEIEVVEAEINDLKCVQHNYSDIIKGEKICFFKNKYPISCKIIPQYTLTEAQKNDIAKNIRQALYDNLNAAMIEFGEELVYEDLYNIILNADSRIKNVALDSLTYRTYAVYTDYETLDDNTKVLVEKELDISEVDKELGDDNKYHLVEGSLINKFRNEIYAKSVLAGKTQFFVQDTEFDFGINQRYQLLERKIGQIDTNLDVVLNKTNNWQYTLKEHEALQLFAPNLIESADFSSNLRFEYYINESHLPIAPNTSYKLDGNEYMIFYQASDSADTEDFLYFVYGDGAIVRPSFWLTSEISAIAPTSLVGNSLIKNMDAKKDPYISVNNTRYKFSSGNSINESNGKELTDAIRDMIGGADASNRKLSGNKSVTILVKNSIKIDNTGYQCYWITKEKSENKYVLFDALPENADEETKKAYGKRILKSGEYFIFTKQDSSDMTILGSGTQIVRSFKDNEAMPTTKLTCTAIDYSEIVSAGLQALEGFWVTLADTHALNLTEMQYMALGTDSIVCIRPKYPNGYPAQPLKLVESESTVYYTRSALAGFEPGYLVDKEGYKYTLVSGEPQITDIYTYYTAITEGRNVIPAVAIRTKDTKIDRSKNYFIKSSKPDYKPGYRVDADGYEYTLEDYPQEPVDRYYELTEEGTEASPAEMTRLISSSDLIWYTRARTEEGTKPGYLIDADGYKYDQVENPVVENLKDYYILTYIGCNATEKIKLNSTEYVPLTDCAISYKVSAAEANWTTVDKILLDDTFSWNALTLLRLNLATGKPQKIVNGQSLKYYKYDLIREKVVKDNDIDYYFNDKIDYKSGIKEKPGTEEIYYYYEYYLGSAQKFEPGQEYILQDGDYLVFYKKHLNSGQLDYIIYSAGAKILNLEYELKDSVAQERELLGIDLIDPPKVQKELKAKGKYEGITDPSFEHYNTIKTSIENHDRNTTSTTGSFVLSANGYAIWAEMKPGIIDPTVDPFSEPTYLLASRLISDIGPEISTIIYDSNDKPVPISIYAYVPGDKDEDVQFLDDGSTELIFRNKAEQTWSKTITFKLPAGDYIMPVMHSTGDGILSKLNIYLSDNISGKPETILYPMYVNANRKPEVYGKKLPKKSDTEYWIDNKIEYHLKSTIKAGTSTELADGEYIVFYNYNPKTDIGLVSYNIYGKGTKVKSTFDLDKSVTVANLVAKNLVKNVKDITLDNEYTYAYTEGSLTEESGLIGKILNLEDYLDNTNKIIIDPDIATRYGNIYKAGNYYLKIKDLLDIKDKDFWVTARVEITYAEPPSTAAEAPGVSIIIPPIFKYSETDAIDTDSELNGELLVDVYEKLKELDYKHLYKYTYVVNGDEEIKNPLDPASYLDHNHVMNPFTISQWDTSDNSNIYITSVTRN